MRKIRSKKSLKLFLTLYLFFTIGCAAPVALAPPALDIEAKKFQPVPKKSVIYVYRGEDVAFEFAVPLSIDGKIIGKTEPESFFVLTVNPGKHQIVSHSEFRHNAPHNTFILNVETKPGKIYYIWNEVNSAFGAGMMCCAPKLYLVDEKKGQAGVKAAKRAMPYAAAP